MIEHRPAGGAMAEWRPTPAELPLEAIKALGARMERSSSITLAEAADIVRQHGGRLPMSSDNPSVMVKLLKVARAERRSRGVDAAPTQPREFRQPTRPRPRDEAYSYRLGRSVRVTPSLGSGNQQDFQRGMAEMGTARVAEVRP